MDKNTRILFMQIPHLKIKWILEAVSHCTLPSLTMATSVASSLSQVQVDRPTAPNNPTF